MMRPVKQILVIGLSNIGDAVLMSPVIQQLHEAHHDARITLLVGERARAVFAHDPRIGQLLCMEDFDGALGRLRLLGAVWKTHADLLIDLRHTALPLLWRPWLAFRYLRPIPNSVVHMRDRHLWRLHVQAPQLKTQDARLKTQVDMSKPSAVTLQPSSIWISQEDVAQTDRLMARWKLNGPGPLVVICPSARSHIKRWSADRFATLADWLIERLGARVVFTGEPEEIPVVGEVLKAMRHPAHSAAGCTTLSQLAALMHRARLVITNDSATLHVACAVRTPVVALFGPTSARKYGPTGPRDRVIQRKLFCAPCEQALCQFSHECMRFISVEEVFEAARQMLTESVRLTVPTVHRTQ